MFTFHEIRFKNPWLYQCFFTPNFRLKAGRDVMNIEIVLIALILCHCFQIFFILLVTSLEL